MQVTDTEIPEVKVLEPRVFGDARGRFYESFNLRDFANAVGMTPNFVQDNHSTSERGVLRGLHFQLPPMAQGKLVRVTQGEVFDVAVDVRKNSATFGKWVGMILSAENNKQLWIPEGFAHGFYVLSDSTEFLYKTTAYYAPEWERCIAWNDPDLAIEWPIEADPILSSKDSRALGLTESELFD